MCTPIQRTEKKIDRCGQVPYFINGLVYYLGSRGNGGDDDYPVRLRVFFFEKRFGKNIY